MSSVETQFQVPPFPPFPSASRYVRVGSQDDALQRVRHAVEAWEAISLVIGPPGTGKSMICQVLQQYFSRDREVIVFGDATLESPLSLQRHLLSRLDRIRGIAPTPPALGDDPQLAIIERIAGSSKEFAGLLLLVDEAQTLSPEVLETIRILTNVISAGRPRVSAVLLGGPRLDETLALPSLDALVQRVATRCYLHPLSSDETVRYIRRVMENCSDVARIEIDETAILAIHRACSGVPRLINQLMTAAISFADVKQQSRITTQIVDGAWSILQQLPGPLIDEPELNRPVSNVEFGPLHDDDPVVETSEPAETRFDESPAQQSDGEELTLMRSVCDHDCEGCDPDIAERDVEKVEDPEFEGSEFTTQTEVGLGGEDASQYGTVTFDCQPASDFDYDHAAARSNSEIAEPNLQSSDHAANDAFDKKGTPSCSELFGEFDDEEQVSPLTQGPLNQDSINQGPKLHLADQADHHGGVDPAPAPEELESAIHREVQNLRATAAPVLWVDDSDDEELVHDDRDMLVIEDDVNVERAVVVNEVHADPAAEASVAIDFHAMLAKMRTPQ